SCANRAATASSVLISSCFHLRAPNLTKPSTPVVISPEISGAAATQGGVLVGLAPPTQQWKEPLVWSGRTTTGFLPCSHCASTGPALVKWTTAIGSGSGTLIRGGHSATSTEARMSWS